MLIDFIILRETRKHFAQETEQKKASANGTCIYRNFKFLLPFKSLLYSFVLIVLTAGIEKNFLILAPDVGRLDNAIHRINHYPVGK